MSDSKSKWDEIEEGIKEQGINKLTSLEKLVLETDKFCKELSSSTNSTMHPEKEIPKHYSNEHGSLYKIGLERGWNPYQFDAIKRIDRAYKKRQLTEDIKKTLVVLDLMLKNQ